MFGYVLVQAYHHGFMGILHVMDMIRDSLNMLYMGLDKKCKIFALWGGETLILC